MVADAVLTYLLFPPGIRACILTKKGFQFVAAFLDIVCAALLTTHITTTSGKVHTNIQTVRYNRIMVTRFRYYVPENLTR